MTFDKRVIELVGTALRIEQIGHQLVAAAEGLYERAIVIAILSADQSERIRYRAREVPVAASEEENDE